MAVILVVDDEPYVNDLVRDHLRFEGHVPVQAFDGQTALTVLSQRQPDLVILDWTLPDLDGLALCRHVRHDHAMPIIMPTGRSEETDLLLGLEAGADDYVVKPFSRFEGMDRTVDTHIRQLRRKLGPLGARIQTVWGIGYRLARLEQTLAQAPPQPAS